MRRVNKRGVVVVEDSFELSETFTSNSKCVLCHRGAEEGRALHAALHASSCDILDSSSDEDTSDQSEPQNTFVSDPQRVWMSKHPLYVNSSRLDFVHFYCALYSPVSWLHNGKNWCNVAQEVRRSFHFTCARCGLKGATLGCMNSKCNYSVHLPCAMEEGWNPSLVNKCSYQCPAHCLQDKDRRNELSQLELKDLSLGREAVEVTVERSLFASAMSLPYIYTAKNLDGDDTQSFVVDIQKVKYCGCTGLGCAKDSKSPCSCSGKTGHQYFRSGPFRCLSPELMNTVCDGERKANLDTIYECGLRCKCSNRCLNRVVGLGLQFQLQITSDLHDSRRGLGHRRLKAPRLDFAAVDSPDGDGDSDGRWNVIVLEDVPAGAFVCEWTGQYVLGDSKPVVPTGLTLRKSMFGRLDDSASMLKRVIDTVAANDKTCRGCDDLGRIVPVDMWESAFPILDPVEWGKHMVKPSKSGETKKGTGNNPRKRPRHSGGNEKNTRASECSHPDELVLKYMQDLIYIDSRYYGNVSRFITLTADKEKSNLSRRSVYVNDDGSNLHPRLALFASQFIPAGTTLELF